MWPGDSEWSGYDEKDLRRLLAEEKLGKARAIRAKAYLDALDRRRAVEADARTAALNSDLAELQRRTADATEAAASAARDSASAAAVANDIARAANELASAANALASRANRRATDANKIAIAAAAIAAATMIGSIVAALLRAPTP